MSKNINQSISLKFNKIQEHSVIFDVIFVIGISNYFFHIHLSGSSKISLIHFEEAENYLIIWRNDNDR